jgi:phage FluMu gp28-like protein
MPIKRAKLWSALNYRPHPGQVAMHAALDDPEVRRLVCLYGRRAGKTHGARFEAIYQALQPPDQFGPPLVYVVSDTYAHAKKLFMAAMVECTTKLAPLVDKVSLSDLTLRFKTGAEIHTKSADNPASLAGDGVKFAIIDESGFVNDYAIEVLMPALSEREGKVLAIGTPDHPNWYRTWFYAGLDGREGQRSLQLPTSVNPHFPAVELARLERTMPDRLYRKYFLAEFVDDEGALFKRELLARRLIHTPEDPKDGHTYVAGVDLARTIDFNVVSIADVSVTPARQVHLERWNATSWEHTVARVIELLRYYNGAHGYVDATGAGDPVFELMEREYANVTAFKFTSASKPPLVENLALTLERGMLELLIDEAQHNEMGAFQAKSTSTGTRYEAPSGQHDDIVIANALLARGVTYTPPEFVLPESYSFGFGSG